MENKASGTGVRPPFTQKRDRLMFLAAALWNWLVALVSLFANEMIRSGLRMPPLADSLNLHLAMSCICLFGIGYYWVARDLSKNQAIVKLGMIGKFGVFAILLGHVISGDIPYALAAPGVIDLVFAALFLEFLMRTRKMEAAANHADFGY